MTNDELQELNDKLNADLMEAQAEIERLRNAAPATAPEQCWCDEQGIGEPGVSCGDCPTRDYKTTAPEQPSWQDAPTVPGLWVRNSCDCIGAYLIHESAIPILQGSRSRWFGPLPEDKQ